jgi:hypothetical protein
LLFGARHTGLIRTSQIVEPALTPNRMHPLPKTRTTTGIVPSLAAFGGWEEADWFSDALLSDTAIVAFEFPKLAGLRKQAFHVIDRTIYQAPPPRGSQEPRKAPRGIAGKLAILLDGAGAVRAVASGRSRFLFDTGPVLFFAAVPSAKLKARAANKLRRELVGMGMRACVLSARADVTTLMFWPSAETGITAFVEAAGPEHRMHQEFDASDVEPVKRLGKASGGADRGAAEREVKLLARIAVLQGQVDALTRAQSAQGALEQLGLDDARLKSMLKLLHPDKHGNSEAANEAAKWLNSMRALIKGGGAS